MSIKENMNEHTNNWDELIKRRAITDLFRIVRDCNNEIEEITEKYQLILRNAIDDLKCRTRYSSEQFMQLEASLHQCNQYFTSDNSTSFEEYIGTMTTKIVESDHIVNPVEKSCIEYDEGTKLALALISHYAEALKDKVLDSASNDMLDMSDE